MLSPTGPAMTAFAVTLQVHDLTRSPAAVGGIGVATFIPLLLIAVPGGILTDRVDRRLLVLMVTLGQAMLSSVFFVLAAFGGASLWRLYMLAVALPALGAAAPARQTFIPRLVPEAQPAAAMALNRVIFQVMMIAGPALTGVVAAGAGLAFIRRSRAQCGAFLADVNATSFGLPLSLFPAINAERYGGDPRTLGQFTTAIGVGGLVSAVFAGPLRHVSRRGQVMLACVAVWGWAFALFPVAPWLWLTLFALGLAGFADAFTVVFRGVIMQAATPEELRGRVSAAEYLAGAGGSQLGSLEAGLVGSLATPVISALSGGLITIFGALAIGAALPGARRYQATAPGAEALAAAAQAPAAAAESPAAELAVPYQPSG